MGAPSKEKRSVLFALEHNQTREYEEDPLVEADQIWYIGEDYSLMKARSKMEAKECRRKGFGVLLRDTFAFPREDAQKHLNALVQLDASQSRRGLERSLSRQHGEERSEMKDRARQSVLIHQRRLRREGAKQDEMAEKLSAMYQEVTRSAFLFARRMGIADEVVVKEGEDSTVALEIVETAQKNNPPPRRPGRMERRLSNYSIMSTHSFDKRRAAERRNSKRCPSSPASPTEEFYAAIA